jgi:protein SCO1
MNKNAAIAVFIALGISMLAYFIMRFVPTVSMPHRLFVDSIVTKVEDGKQKTDTIWKKVPDFNLTNHLGQQVSWKDLEGKIVVADFIFTTCPAICPAMTTNMKKLQDAIKSADKVGNREANFIHFLSFTVDPQRDSVEVLKKYADRYQINPRNWWLLTGDKKEIYDLAYYGMSLGISETEIDTGFIHPQQFVLIDKQRVIRARKDNNGNVDLYNGLDTMDLKKLAEDIILLSVEKSPDRKSPLAGKLELIAIVFGVIILGIILFVIYTKRQKERS